MSRADAWPSTRTDLDLRGSALCRRNPFECLDGDLLVTAFDADDHLILVADGHFQLHWVVLLDNGAGGSNTTIQQTRQGVAENDVAADASLTVDCKGRTGSLRDLA